MEVPVKNLVETVDLTAEDVLLPMLECVVNSIISLQKSQLPANEKKIQIQITRGDLPEKLNFDNVKTISGFKVIDNGVGFNNNNYKSFQTPFSQINKDFGCKGIGRFTVLAAYKDFLVDSNYLEDTTWYIRKFRFSTEKELEIIEFGNSQAEQAKTVVEIQNCTNHILIEKSAISLLQISESIMQHCFIYYLNNSLPRIEVIDLENNEVEVINELF
ncbi:hypothetical protein, partial [Pedobacter antarcticus]